MLLVGAAAFPYSALFFCFLAAAVPVESSFAPVEWRDRIDSNMRLFSKDLYCTSKSHQPSFPLLIPSVGNGYLATVIGSDEVFVGGLFNGKNHNGIEGSFSSHRARIPAFLNLNITGALVDIQSDQNYNLYGGFAIDIQEGTFYERIFVEDEKIESIAQIEQRRYAHREFSSILVHEIHIDNTISMKPSEVTISVVCKEGEPSADISFVELLSESTEEYRVLQGEIVRPEVANGLSIKVGVIVSQIPSKIVVPAGEKRSVTFIMSIRSSIPGDKVEEGEEPYTAALREFKEALYLQESSPYSLTQRSRLLDSHIKSWENEIWSKGSLSAGGNDELDRVIKSSLYWILLSTRTDWPWNLSPGSLASNAYNGHSFWDTETWMYPPMLMLYPDIAKSLLEYRFNHLEASKAKARAYNHCNEESKLLFECVVWPMEEKMWNTIKRAQQDKYKAYVANLLNTVNKKDMPEVNFTNRFTKEIEVDKFQGNCGYKGALFAWESGFTGVEVCPCMAGGTCLHEHHVSGDIAFAVYQYWEATHDLEWLQRIGFPLAKEIALFWESRLSFNGIEYEILHVIPPDESAMGVSNSVFTNVVAKYSFHIATEFASLLGEDVPDVWMVMAAKLKIPFSHEFQLHLEYDGYEGKGIKQADVILLGYPLHYPMSHTIRENDLNFYSSVTSRNGPAMTWSVTAIGYLEVLAYRTMEMYCSDDVKYTEEDQELLEKKVNFYFFHSYQNAQKPYFIWTETPNGGAYNFITGAGGFLQAVIAGYGGVRLKADGMHITYPMLPLNTDSLDLRMIDFLGNQFDLFITENEFTLTLKELGDIIELVEIDFCSTLSDEETILQPVEWKVQKSIAFPRMKHLLIRPVGQPHNEDWLSQFGEPIPLSLLHSFSIGFGCASILISLLIILCTFIINLLQ